VLDTPRGALGYPFARLDPMPTSADPIGDAFIDEEMGGEGITYRLRSGAEGFVLMDMAYDYNREPQYMRDLVLFRLSLEAQRAFAESRLAKREVVRRLGTSASQLYRLLDQTNYDKTVDSMLALLSVLGCDVELKVRSRSA
jgi:hypothetical protein